MRMEINANYGKYEAPAIDCGCNIIMNELSHVYASHKLISFWLYIFRFGIISNSIFLYTVRNAKKTRTSFLWGFFRGRSFYWINTRKHYAISWDIRETLFLNIKNFFSWTTAAATATTITLSNLRWYRPRSDVCAYINFHMRLKACCSCQESSESIWFGFFVWIIYYLCQVICSYEFSSIKYNNKKLQFHFFSNDFYSKQTTFLAIIFVGYNDSNKSNDITAPTAILSITTAIGVDIGVQDHKFGVQK